MKHNTLKKNFWVKKLVSAVLTFSLIFSMSATCFAADNEEPDISVMSTTGTVSGTAKDSYGNKYAITGTSLCNGRYATSQTSFKVSLYAGGGDAADKAKVNGYVKTLKAKGTASFLNSAVGNYGNSSSSMTGASGTISRTGGEYSYTVIAVTSTHTFSCKGASNTFTSNAAWV